MDYDAIVAGVLGLEYSEIHGLWFGSSADTLEGYYLYPAQDYNALHAAIDALEECEHPTDQKVQFYRDYGVWKVWDLKTGKPLAVEEYDEQPEHLAIAKCIAAAVGEKDG